MQRFAIALAAVLAAASSAQAVSVAITADQPSYLPGDTITLSVIVDATGAYDTGIYGQFSYDTAILTGGSVSQNALTSFGGFVPWVLGPVGCSDEPGFCSAFNQQVSLTPYLVDQPAGFVISTITFTAGAVGSTDLVWSTGPPYEFRFFGLTTAPGTTVQVVPEPATAALLALGLVALGAARRVRS